MGLLKNEVNFTVTLTHWLKESRAISSTNYGIAQTRFPGLSDSHLFLLSVPLTILWLPVSAFWNINSYYILVHKFYCKTAISLTLARGFVYHEEDFYRSSHWSSTISDWQTGFTARASSKFLIAFFYVLGLVCLGVTRFLKCTCRWNKSIAVDLINNFCQL